VGGAFREFVSFLGGGDWSCFGLGCSGEFITFGIFIGISFCGGRGFLTTYDDLLTFWYIYVMMDGVLDWVFTVWVSRL